MSNLSNRKFFPFWRNGFRPSRQETRMDTPSPKHCPSCGTVLGQDADGLADGLCSRCLLASSLAAGHGFTKRFEAMALATLNMVTVHVFGHRDDFYFLLMES